jgi:hypothetical protein
MTTGGLARVERGLAGAGSGVFAARRCGMRLAAAGIAANGFLLSDVGMLRGFAQHSICRITRVSRIARGLRLVLRASRANKHAASALIALLKPSTSSRTVHAFIYNARRQRCNAAWLRGQRANTRLP